MNDGLTLKPVPAPATDPKAQAQTQAQADRDRLAARKVAREFEAMFVGQMLKSMRTTVPESGLTGGHAEEIYRGMLDQEYASAIASQRSLGLAQMLESQLIRQNQVRPAGSTSGGNGNDR